MKRILFILLIPVGIIAQEDTPKNITIEQKLVLFKKYSKFLENKIAADRAMQLMEASQKELDEETTKLQSVCEEIDKTLVRQSDGDFSCVEKKK